MTSKRYRAYRRRRLQGKGGAAIDHREQHAPRQGRLERDKPVREPVEKPTDHPQDVGLPFGIPVDRPRRNDVDPADQWRPTPEPQPRPGGRPGRAGLRRVLLVAGALAILLAGFLLGAGLTDGGVAPTRSVPDPAASAPTPSATAPGTGTSTGQVPQQCVTAIQRADQAISYLIGNIRDRRLSESMLAFVETKNACLDLTTR